MEKKIYKPFKIEMKAGDKEKREMTVIGSQLQVDRDKDIVDIKTMNLSNYKTNPVVLWSHRAEDPPIGKAVSVMKAGGNTQLKFKIQFAKAEDYSFADTIYRLAKNGYINSSSIGFLINHEKSEFDKNRGGYNINNAELLELSLVNIPANPGAMISSRTFQKALEDEVIDDVEMEEVKQYLKHVKVEEEVEPEVEEEVEVKNEKPSNELTELREQIKKLTQKIEALENEVVQDESPYTYIDDLFEDLADELDLASIDSSDADDDIDDLINQATQEL